MPVVRRLLLDLATETGLILAVCGADGILRWVEGDPVIRRNAEAMNFGVGADWSEGGAGTNAPGTALLLDSAIQIHRSEHFCHAAHSWSCTAAPIHDLTSGSQLGAIDLTGDSAAASPQTLALLRATAAAVESHLALQRPLPPVVGQQPRIAALRGDRPRWEFIDEHGQPRVTALTQRHAEILILLSRHPSGLSAEELAVLLDERDLDPVTVRAEMSRLRRVLGAEVVGSRPYRLTCPVSSDIDTVFGALAAGNVGDALEKYAGPLLPRSDSPAVAEIRSELSETLRAAVLAAENIGLLQRWLELPDARYDDVAWRTFRARARHRWSSTMPRHQDHR